MPRPKTYYFFIGLYLLFILVHICLSSTSSPFRLFSLVSTSMSPQLSPGSLVLVHRRPEYSPGQIIVFRSPDYSNDLIAHRITALGGNVYVTKGDANQSSDRHLVLPRQIIGRIILAVPALGPFYDWLNRPYGTFLTVILPAVVIISIELTQVIRLLPLVYPRFPVKT